MYTIEHTDPIDANEPQLGIITEHEVFEDYKGEARERALTQMADEQEVQTNYSYIDSITDNDTEFPITNYFSTKEIDLLNSMFMEDNEWTEKQLSYILDNLVTKCLN